MSILSVVGNLISGGVLDKVIGLVGDYQDKKLTKEQLEYEIKTLAERQAHEIQLAQIDTNKEEAKSHSAFVAGWRPAMGWICVCGFGINFLVGPIATFVAGLMGSAIIFPTLDLSEMLPVLFGMLGLGAYRTFEKKQGVSRDNIK